MATFKALSFSGSLLHHGFWHDVLEVAAGLQ